MDRTVPIVLVAESWTQDNQGINTKTETERSAFASISSVSSTEFFEGGRNGLNPEFRFKMFIGDYKGEKIIEFNGVRYTIYRTFAGRSHTIELYAERREGNG